MKRSICLLLIASISSCSSSSLSHYSPKSQWIPVDNFEQEDLINWHKADTQNNTKPFVGNPQITEIRKEGSNQFLIKKPAKDGLVGNRKALSFKALPLKVAVGETFTFYTEISVERFPNNHAFGLSNMDANGIVKHAYDAFEPMLRVTDKYESNGFKNDGTLMVKTDSENKHTQYTKIQNYNDGKPAEPLQTSQWYKIWYVVNNSSIADGGQNYDVYVHGGEFQEQTLVFKQANFRMKRERPLIYFLATCNSGPHDAPYGNGGLMYDNIYMSKGLNLSRPTVKYRGANLSE